MFTASLSTLFPKENTHPASQAYFVCWFAVVMLLKLIFYAEKEAQAGSLAHWCGFPRPARRRCPSGKQAPVAWVFRAGPGSAGFISVSAQPSALCVPVSRGVSEPGALTLEVFGTHR